MRASLEQLQKAEGDHSVDPAVREATSQLKRKVHEAEEAEQSAWRKEFLMVALGPEPTSCISQLLASHKL
eukprot:5072821-Prymnesium_polylepis.1